MSLHGLLIGLHAAAGTAAFVFGTVAIWRPRPLPIYLLALIPCILLLAGAIAIDWGGLSGGTRALYLALSLLGAYMIWSGARALVLKRRGMATASASLDSLGFTLVALADAFAVILVLRFAAPTWTIVITALAVATVGNPRDHRTKAPAVARTNAPGNGTRPRARPNTHTQREPIADRSRASDRRARTCSPISYEPLGRSCRIDDAPREFAERCGCLSRRRTGRGLRRLRG